MSAESSDRLTPQSLGLPLSYQPPVEETPLASSVAAVGEAIYIEALESRRIVYWSPTAAALFRYDAGQILKQSAARLFASENDFAGHSLEELESKGVWEDIRRYRRANGEIFEAATRATLWRSIHGGYIVHAIQVDHAATPQFENWADPQIFEVLKQNEQLQKSAERKQGEQMIGQILRHVINDALFVADAAGYILDWNHAAGALLGYDRREVCGQHLSLVCLPGEERSIADVLRQAGERGRARCNQWMTRKDGKRIYASVSVFALGGDRPQAEGYLFLVRDDSRQRNFKQKAREKEQMAAIGTAASMLAHEIGNPLNGISATVQLLEHFVIREKSAAAPAMLSSIHDLKSEIHRLTTLLNQFKNIAWPRKLALGPVDVPRLIQAVVESIEKRASRQGIEVSVECPPELPSVEGDAEKLNEALLHVIENAVEAMPHGGRLDIKSYRCDDSLCIDIADTGVGIPENVKVFDLFSSTKPHGTGFGLFIVQQIILAHDGTVTYSSTPGQGTTFHLAFNLQPAPESFDDELIEAL